MPVSELKATYLIISRMTHKLPNGGIRTAANESTGNDWSLSASLCRSLITKFEILLKTTGCEDSPFDMEPKPNPARSCLVEVEFLTCAGDLQLPGRGERWLPDICRLKFELDALVNQKIKPPASFDTWFKASWKAIVSGTCKNPDWCNGLSTNELIWEKRLAPNPCDNRGSKGNVYWDSPFKSMNNNQLFLITASNSRVSNFYTGRT